MALTERAWYEVNAKPRYFYKNMAKECEVEIDNVYDLHRCCKVIGSLNLKISDGPRETNWKEKVKRREEDWGEKLSTRARFLLLLKRKNLRL